MIILPELETERLILRPIRIEDAASIFAYAKNIKVAEFTLWEAHSSVNDTLSFIQNYVIPSYTKGQPEPFGITIKENKDIIIGTAGCFFVSGCNHTMELGYALSQEYWGKGIMAEACRTIIPYVFKNFPIERLQCRCKYENQASFRVMEKLGFQKEGILRNVVYHRGRYWDMIYSSFLRQELPISFGSRF